MTEKEIFSFITEKLNNNIGVTYSCLKRSFDLSDDDVENFFKKYSKLNQNVYPFYINSVTNNTSYIISLSKDSAKFSRILCLKPSNDYVLSYDLFKDDYNNSQPTIICEVSEVKNESQVGTSESISFQCEKVDSQKSESLKKKSKVHSIMNAFSKASVKLEKRDLTDMVKESDHEVFENKSSISNDTSNNSIKNDEMTTLSVFSDSENCQLTRRHSPDDKISHSARLFDSLDNNKDSFRTTRQSRHRLVLNFDDEDDDDDFAKNNSEITATDKKILVDDSFTDKATVSNKRSSRKPKSTKSKQKRGVAVIESDEEEGNKSIEQLEQETDKKSKLKSKKSKGFKKRKVEESDDEQSIGELQKLESKKPILPSGPRMSMHKVEHTYMDDEGFLVTERVVETVTESRNKGIEEPHSKSVDTIKHVSEQKVPASKPKANSSKKTVVDSKQRSITSFFKIN